MATRHRYVSAEQRFWACVAKSDGCWVWTGYRDKDGYGRIGVNDKRIGAHQFSYSLHCGQIPTGMCVCHRCDNPACVRPDHLFLGTVLDNNKDRTQKGRTASGDRNGHSTKPENTKRGMEHYNYNNPNAPQKGSGNGRAKLNENGVRQIRWMWDNGTRTKSEIARFYGVTDTTIGNIINRKLWKHVE